MTSFDSAALVAELGPDKISTDEAHRRLMSADVSVTGPLVEVVVRPTSAEEIAASLQAAREQGLAVVPRGGGMSYSSGYLCDHDRVMLMDLSAMNRVLEINTEDMYVTVQVGCSWQALHDALDAQGVRTPFWGTLSGLKATVGGGMSQNGILWGSGRHGCAADSVIGLEVVLASGEILHTGAGAQRHAPPFFRHYGPDLTGLFCCDNGALGIKATATLQLIKARPGRAFLSFHFPSHRPLMEAMAAVSREGLADACFAFDPALQRQRMKRESLLSDVKSLGNVVKSQGSALRGIKEGMRVAMAGRRFVDEEAFSVHFTVEEASQAAADLAAERIRKLCRNNGREIENSIPKIARANPFAPLNSMIGPGGERWLPVHGLVPHSRAVATYEAIEALFQRHAQALARESIIHGYLLTYIGASASVIEPVFYWPDCLHELHRQTVEPGVLSKVEEHPANASARALVMELRAEINNLFREMGSVHMHIGRT